jgi:phage gp29-like protein
MEVRMTLLDARGREIPLTDASSETQVYRRRGSDRKYEAFIANLSPQRLRAAQADNNVGKCALLQTYFEQAVLTDSFIRSMYQRRLGVIASMEFEIHPYRERDVDGDWSEPTSQDVSTAEVVRRVFDRIQGWRGLLYGILSAIPYGFSVHQIRWQSLDGLFVPFFEWLPNRKITFACANPTEEVELYWPNVLTDDNPQTGSYLEPIRTLYCVYGQHPEPWNCGLMHPTLTAWMRKHELMRQRWSTGERFAEPMLIGYVGVEEQNTPLTESLLNIMKNVGPGSYNVIPGTGGNLVHDSNGMMRGGKIDFLQPNMTIPQNFWDAGIDDCNKEIGILWTGGNLLSDTTGGTGTHAAASTQRESEYDSIVRNDAKWLEDDALDQLVRLIVAVNVGDTSRLPSVALSDLAPIDDRKVMAEIYSILGGVDWGAVSQMPLEVREELGLPELAEIEETQDDNS